MSSPRTTRSTETTATKKSTTKKSTTKTSATKKITTAKSAMAKKSTATKSTRSTVDRIAREDFGWTSLLPGQREAIESAAAGRDTLLVLATGGGKSAVYQIAGAERGGVVLVVSPLVALQADQLASIGAAPAAPPAVAVNSAQGTAAVARAWERIDEGGPLYVLLAPEQLAKEENVARLAAAGVSLLVVDEAHCVSSWGHDFRPDYLRLKDVRSALGDPPVLAMTATASRPVREEIIERLGMTDPEVQVHGVDRPEIRLVVHRHESENEKRTAVAEEARSWTAPGLVYVATRKETETYAAEIAAEGRSVAAYHAGLKTSERRDVHRQWRDGELDVVVATSAFGMGIDRGDVRFVLHATTSESLDAYYQEIGRAGRDSEPATAALHYRLEDLGLRRFFAKRRVEPAALRVVWAAVSDRPGVQVDELAEALGKSPRTVARLVNDLAEADLLETEGGLRAVSDASGDAAVRAVKEELASRERIAESRLSMMRAYAETSQCRRRVLLDYFGVEGPEWCGNCDGCERHEARQEAAQDAPADAPLSVDETVEHRAWGAGTVMSVEDDRATIFFETEGYKVLSFAALESGVLREREAVSA
ncbi:RecQ family ATP-dependent DNA helicase [Rathayibacter sp. VKM Ac-2760]|uniref:RecQ family ATP-dependent DNA helicase n=1 Tax=Rathayibacter sp. VKM Ac-2760 TaxID=2609253 RepID=UPI0013177A1B|nr:RecQ family ATP-dependent DNA helicase [Rathayibacter sp. VKM Ac-2760]QHC58193.1 RecQ family ATP-dependent DNA helicase [Rathayibacter sp. VKM Ac-2760]